jgi:hypothetical protein
MKKEIDRKFQQKGSVVVMSETVPDVELTDKDVINNIEGFEARIQQTEDNIHKLQDNLKTSEDDLIALRDGLKKINHFKEWAENYQLSKVKTIIDEEFEKCRLLADAEYKIDVSLSDEQNARAKYMLLQRKIANCESVREKLARSTITKYLFTESLVKNPYL